MGEFGPGRQPPRTHKPVQMAKVSKSAICQECNILFYTFKNTDRNVIINRRNVVIKDRNVINSARPSHPVGVG